MAARPLPEVAQVDIVIQPGGTVSAAFANLKLTNGSIYFTNTATFPVNIVFTNSLSNISGLQQGTNSASQGAASVTVNYVIVNATTRKQTGGPYSVQFDVGPLPISITSLTPTPDPIALPEGGEIQFTSDVEYNIGWATGGGPPTVWSPQPPTVSAGQNPTQTALPGASGLTLTYSLSDSRVIRGGGTVKIGN